MFDPANDTNAASAQLARPAQTWKFKFSQLADRRTLRVTNFCFSTFPPARQPAIAKKWSAEVRGITRPRTIPRSASSRPLSYCNCVNKGCANEAFKLCTYIRASSSHSFILALKCLVFFACDFCHSIPHDARPRDDFFELIDCVCCLAGSRSCWPLVKNLRSTFGPWSNLFSWFYTAWLTSPHKKLLFFEAIERTDMEAAEHLFTQLECREPLVVDEVKQTFHTLFNKSIFPSRQPRLNIIRFRLYFLQAGSF